MRARTIFCALAATMMLFAACGKDDDNKNSGGSGGGSGLSIADNTLMYDGVTYTFDYVMVDYYHPELTLVNATTSDTTESGEPLLSIDGIHITPNAWNKSFDLADNSNWPDEISVYLIFNGALDISFDGWVNVDRDISGHLDGVDYEGESIFESGTYSVSGNNDGTPITVTVDGMLKNGKTLQMKIVTPSYRNQVTGR